MADGLLGVALPKAYSAHWADSTQKCPLTVSEPLGPATAPDAAQETT